MAVVEYFVGGMRSTKLGVFPNEGGEIQKMDIFFYKNQSDNWHILVPMLSSPFQPKVLGLWPSRPLLLGENVHNAWNSAHGYYIFTFEEYTHCKCMLIVILKSY